MLEVDIGLQQSSSRALTYDVFLSEYWSHFPTSLTGLLGMQTFFAASLG